ncbi:hypothetical protein [Foetidibacter luteolus]|uniref:hypothetical protein n=1 Tax=Foetidibacter luteolus TaxID=2608880 RepID=UPI00129ADE85|nr:hypothetical protein [Foetidibacter luteolus]
MNTPVSTTAITAIAGAALLAGTLDILAAIIMFTSATGKSPVIVLQFIASGVFGKAAFSGDPMMPVWGTLFHYMIATGFTLLYFWLYPKTKLLRQNIFTSAVIYGIFVWAVMNLLIVPLSKTSPVPFDAARAVQAVLVLIICIGLPIAFIASRYYKRKANG